MRRLAVLLAVVVAGAVWWTRGDSAVARGRVLYDTHCAACHGDRLQGQPDWQSAGPDGIYPAPPHDASGHTWHHSDAELHAYIALGGAAALARDGVRFDSGMPGFGEALSADQIDDILAYIKSHWPARERRFQAERSGRTDG